MSTEAVQTHPEPAARRGPGIPIGLAAVLPAQLTVMFVVLVPTLIVIWLSLTDWQPTAGIPWYKAEVIWFLSFSCSLTKESIEKSR